MQLLCANEIDPRQMSPSTKGVDELLTAEVITRIEARDFYIH